MLKNKNETLIEILLIISLFLSFLDAYQLFNIPLNWIGGSMTILIFVILYFYENMKLPSLIKLGVVIALIPTLPLKASSKDLLLLFSRLQYQSLSCRCDFPMAKPVFHNQNPERYSCTGWRKILQR